MTRVEQLHDQAEFLRSLAASSSISSKRDQLLKAADQCEALADTFGHPRAKRPEPAPLGVAEPHLRLPVRTH